MQQRKSRPDSFKRDAVRRLLAPGPKTVAEIAKELGVSQSMLHRWRERFEPELRGGTQPSQSDREEVERLRRDSDSTRESNPLPGCPLDRDHFSPRR